MLNILTLAFNAMPFLERHLPVFEKLSVPWKWVIVHGPANNGGSTGWCQPQKAGLSTDGTTEYLASIKDHQNVVLVEQDLWKSKDVMVNVGLDMLDFSNKFQELDGILLQVDADEIWRADQLEEIVRLFNDFPQVGSMRFDCDYFVGPDLVATGKGCWGHLERDWLRSWRFTAGQRFERHEGPDGPVLSGNTGYRMTPEQTARVGVRFQHFAWATEAQVRFKQAFYGGAYSNAVNDWLHLQNLAPIINFPVPLKNFFPWVTDNAMVERYNPPINPKYSEAIPELSVINPDMYRPLNGSVLRFAHAGMSGDIIAALPSIRALGGGILVVTGGDYGQRASMKGAPYEGLRSLLEFQPYIHGVEWQEQATSVTHDFRGFRPNRDRRQNLAENHAQAIGVDIRLEPWLSVPDVEMHGKVVFSRSLRYHGTAFPWKELVSKHSNAIFVGTDEEYAAFKLNFGMVARAITPTVLDVARLIAGCSLFVGNQSLPFWLAAGLGVPLIQECWPSDPNSIVPRENAEYV